MPDKVQKCVELVDNEIQLLTFCANYGLNTGTSLLAISVASMAFCLSAISLFLGTSLQVVLFNLQGFPITLNMAIIIFLALGLIWVSRQAPRAGPAILQSHHLLDRINELYHLRRQLLYGEIKPNVVETRRRLFVIMAKSPLPKQSITLS